MILLPGRRELVTLRDADDYITSLPKAEQNLDVWQAVVEALLLVVNLNGPDHHVAHRRHEGIEPPRRVRVQLSA